MADTPSLHASTGALDISPKSTEPGPERRPQKASRSFRGPRGGLSQARGWLPAAFTVTLTVAVAAYFGTPVKDLALFGAYTVLCLGLPGTLLIRALYRGRRTLAEETALGLALGYAIEIFAYITARAAGAPLLVLAWPVTTCLVFLLIPRLRRHWKSHARVRPPAWWSWALALAFTLILACSGVTYFKENALTWPALTAGGHDVPFHLALVGELKHHMPPAMPTVAGDPLYYHWFAYAHLAAASWITGVEPMVLLFRLAMLPMLAAFLVLIGMTARRIIGSWAGAWPALVGTIFVGAPSLYLTSNLVLGWGGLQLTAWRSPTLTLGALLFAPLVMLIIGFLTHRRQRTGEWLLAAVFSAAVMGTKAVYLPLLLAGLVAVIALKAVTRRRPLRPGLTALAMTVACLAYAQLVLFGQARQGMAFAPVFAMRERWEELTGQDATTAGAASLAGLTLLLLLCWTVTWCGITGLLKDRRLLARPAVVLSLGMGAAGHALMLLFQHPGHSQFQFLFAAYPYLVIVTIYGARVLLRGARVPVAATACAVAAGALAAILIPVLCAVRVPLGPGSRDTALYLPYIVLLIATALAGAVLLAITGRLRTGALLVASFTGISLLACGYSRAFPGGTAEKGVDGAAPRPADVDMVVPQGTLTAARWLRAHSDPGDLVATNTHCRWRYHPCGGQFWAAALTERRILLEGWSYSPKLNDTWRPGMDYHRLPFWDAGLLHANDAAINTPTAALMALLRERYKVRWLLVDQRRAGPASRLGDFAVLRFRSGDYAVYRIPDDSAH